MFFQKLREAKLTVNTKKCNFFQTFLKFLGHIVSAAGTQVYPDKTKAVEEFPVPTNIKAVRLDQRTRPGLQLELLT